MSPKKITRPLDVYVRVSRVGGREGDSYITEAVQEERCRALATARGLAVGQVFVDRDQSGGKMTRPAFEQALARIAGGESGGIIVARLDRFARTLIGGLQTLEQIREAGGVVLTAEGDFDTSTNTGELVLNLMLSLAQFELRRIRENWDVARQRAVERGVHISGAPAGYRKRQDGGLEPSENAPAVIRAFEMRAEGASQSEIGRHLIREGVPTMWMHRAASSWSLRAVQLLLQNRVYLGEARSGAYVKEDAHEPLISRGLFKAVQQRRGTARAASKNGGEGPLLGGGLLRCGTCGCRMSLDSTRARGTVYRFYRCKSNPGCEARTSISALQVEPLVVEGALERLGGVAYEYVEYSGNAEEAELDAALAALAAEEAEIEADLQAGEITPRAAGRVLSDIERRREELEAGRPAVRTGETVREFLTAGYTRELFDRMRVSEQRKVLSTLVERAVVRKGKGEGRVTVEWADFRPERHGLLTADAPVFPAELVDAA